MPLTRLVRGGEQSALTPLDRQALTPAAGPPPAPAAPSLKQADRVVTGITMMGEIPAVREATGPNLAVEPQTQVGNACGTTSLSMVLTYFGAPAGVRQVGTIDGAIRPHTRDLALDSFTAPVDLARYANRHGFRAVLHQDSRPDDLARLVDQGVPPIILYDSSANLDGTGLHYVVVSGYRDNNGEREWAISDPGGYTWQMPNADLLRAWSHLKVNGIAIPYNRLMIAVAPNQGTVRLPNGAVTPATAVQLPSANSPRIVDWAGGVATGAVGVATRVYDTAQSVGGAIQQGGRWVRNQFSSAGSTIAGLLHR